MKNTKYVLSLICGAALAMPFAAMAESISVSASISCPDIGNAGTQKVVNSGTILSGKGSERLHFFPSGTSQTINPTWSAATPAGVPIDLVAGGYANSGTAYSAATNLVTCKFSSASNPAFELTYELQNIKNGVVTSSGNEEIKIKFAVGLKN